MSTIEDLPITIIEASRTQLDLREVWRYRELLFFFVWRDVKIRYRQMAFGFGWAVLQPVLLMVVFSFVLGKLAKVPSNGLPYSVFTYSALVPWMLFAQGATSASNSLVESANLVTKTYFPRLILPVAAATSHAIDFGAALGVLIAMMIGYGLPPSPLVAITPLLVIGVLFCALAVGIWLAAVNVKYRDVRYAVPFMIQLWLFASPVAYPSTLVPARWRVLVGLNPMAGMIEGFRWALVGGSPPGPMVMVSITIATAMLAIGVAYFRRAERSFADWV